MASQIALIPVSPGELTEAAYRLALLEQQDEECDEAWAEAKREHQETKAVIKKGKAEARAVILRAKAERDEGLTRRQVDALLDQAAERGGAQ